MLFDTGALPIFNLKSLDFTFLNDIDASAIGTPRVAPGHRVVAHCAAARLQQPALYGKTRVFKFKKWAQFTDALLIQKDGIGTRPAHGVSPTGKCIALRVGMKKINDPTLGDHGIVVKILFEIFP